jgi:hypothetical protein
MTLIHCAFASITVPITFKERPKPQAALVGVSRITMECEVVGEPKPNVTWYQNTEIEPVKGQKGRISTSDHNLLIATVYGKDNGVYQCVADNGVELEQSSAEFYAGCKYIKLGRIPGTIQQGFPLLSPLGEVLAAAVYSLTCLTCFGCKNL